LKGCILTQVSTLRVQ